MYVTLTYITSSIPFVSKQGYCIYLGTVNRHAGRVYIMYTHVCHQCIVIHVRIVAIMVTS